MVASHSSQSAALDKEPSQFFLADPGNVRPFITCMIDRISDEFVSAPSCFLARCPIGHLQITVLDSRRKIRCGRCTAVACGCGNCPSV
jgi:hypothetical protein